MFGNIQILNQYLYQIINFMKLKLRYIQDYKIILIFPVKKKQLFLI